MSRPPAPQLVPESSGSRFKSEVQDGVLRIILTIKQSNTIFHQFFFEDSPGVLHSQTVTNVIEIKVCLYLSNLTLFETASVYIHPLAVGSGSLRHRRRRDCWYIDKVGQEQLIFLHCQPDAFYYSIFITMSSRTNQKSRGLARRIGGIGELFPVMSTGKLVEYGYGIGKN